MTEQFQRGLSSVHNQRSGRAARFAGEIASDQPKKVLDNRSSAKRQLSSDQIDGLDAIGSFVDLRDTSIPDLLLHTPFADIPMAAEDLLRLDRAFEAEISESRLDDRC